MEKALRSLIMQQLPVLLPFPGQVPQRTKPRRSIYPCSFCIAHRSTWKINFGVAMGLPRCSWAGTSGWDRDWVLSTVSFFRSDTKWTKRKSHTVSLPKDKQILWGEADQDQELWFYLLTHFWHPHERCLSVWRIWNISCFELFFPAFPLWFCVLVILLFLLSLISNQERNSFHYLIQLQTSHLDQKIAGSALVVLASKSWQMNSDLLEEWGKKMVQFFHHWAGKLDLFNSWWIICRRTSISPHSEYLLL